MTIERKKNHGKNTATERKERQMINIESFRITRNDKLNVQIDELRYVVSQKDKSKGEMRYIFVGYYPSLASALISLIPKLICPDDVESLNDVIDRIEELEQTITDVIKETGRKL